MAPLIKGDILKDNGLLADETLHLVAARPFPPISDCPKHHPQPSLEETHQYEVVGLVNWDSGQNGDDYIMRRASASWKHISHASLGSNLTSPTADINICFRMKVLEIDGLGVEATAAGDAMMRSFFLLPIHDNITTIHAIFRSATRMIIMYDDGLTNPGNVLSDHVVHDWIGILSRSRLERVGNLFSKMCHAVELCHQNGVVFGALNPTHFVIPPDNISGQRSDSVILSLPKVLATRVAQVQNGGDTAGASFAPEVVFKLGLILLQLIYGSLPWTSLTHPLYQSFIVNPREFLEARYMALSVGLATFLGEKVFGSTDQRISAAGFADWVENNLVDSVTSDIDSARKFEPGRGYQAILRKIRSLVKDVTPCPLTGKPPAEIIEGFLPTLHEKVDSIVKNWSFDELYWLAGYISLDLERLFSDSSKQQAGRTASRLLCRLYLCLRTLPSKLSLQHVRPDGLGIRAEGGFAKVERGHLEGEEIAIKHEHWAMSSDPETVRLSIVREGLLIFLLNVLGAPRILPLRGVASLNPAQPPSLITPWMADGTLKEYLERNISNISNEELIVMMLRIAETVEGVHERNLVHGNISMRNILVDAKGIPWISDLGLSAFTDVDMGRDPNLNAGTINYLAAELCGPAPPGNSTPGSRTDGSASEEVGRTKASDVTALAGVFLAMWTGQKPYYQYLNVRYQITKGRLPLRQPAPRRNETFWKEVPDDLWKLLVPCWAMDMSQRPTAAQLATNLRGLIGNEALRTQSIIVAGMAMTLRGDAVAVPDLARSIQVESGAPGLVLAMQQLPQPRCRIPSAT